MLSMILLFIGTTEIIIIGGIALLIFGGKKLPELMHGLGKGVKEFKTGMNEVKQEITGENSTEQPQTEEETLQEQAPDISNNE